MKYNITNENILAHELIGLFAKIIATSSKERLGIEGEIVFETKNLIFIQDEKGIKKIPKKETVFEITLPNKSKARVEGKKIIAKPEERIKLYWRKYYGRM